MTFPPSYCFYPARTLRPRKWLGIKSDPASYRRGSVAGTHAARTEFRLRFSYLVIWYHQDLILQLQSRFRVIFPPNKLNYQGILHREHRIIVEIFTFTVEDLGCDWFESVQHYLKVLYELLCIKISKHLLQGEYGLVGKDVYPSSSTTYRQVHP
jgi:hypothetical protein